ncbi:hypothetical protein [Rhizobium lentis]|uniref:hypothetical protein n=1 Tax=Rhizobium lentis TaxID=1138194 RepID=UPI001622E16E|nr:hypothetical protein [Rhizobium lentis]MBB4576252.1 hypothetical protein [Rhizobium lentis]
MTEERWARMAKERWFRVDRKVEPGSAVERWCQVDGGRWCSLDGGEKVRVEGPEVVPGDTRRAGRDQPSATEKALSVVRLAAKPTTLSVIPGLDPGIHDQALGFYFSTVGLFTDPA